MNRGLTALPIRRFQTGGATASGAPAGFFGQEAETGFASMMSPEAIANMQAEAEAQAQAQADAEAMGFASPTTAPAAPAAPTAQAEPAIGLMGLTSPVANIGPLSVTPMDVMSLAVPALAPVNMAINAINSLAAFNAQQAPAPISVATPMDVAALQAEAEANQAEAVAAQQAAVDAEDAAMGLAAMNAQAQAEAEAAPSIGDVAAVSDAVAAAQAATDAADAAAGAAAADAGDAGAAAGDSGGGGGGDSGAGAAGGDSSGDSGGDSGSDGGSSGGDGGGGDGGGSSGERAGGIIKRYQFGGGVMGGMGDSSPRYSYAPLMMAEGGLAAAHKARSMGRGQDTMLVHMTPGEVRGLQALAMAQGGSLSINPKTGLPEAGILSSLLPMVAGFALGPAGFGLMSSLQAGLTVGALTGLATGSLKKGLMAGLGAYGGAGVGEGLVSAATPAEAAAAQVAQAPTSAFEMAQSNIDPSILESGLGAGSKDAIMQQAIQSPAYQQALTSPQLAGSPSLDAMTAADVAQSKVLPGQAVVSTPGAAPTGFEAAKSGLENVFKPAAEGGATARKAFGEAIPFGTTMAVGAPLAMAAAEPPPPIEPSASFIRPYGVNIYNPSGTPAYSIGDSREREQVRYAFTPQPIYRAAQGGEINPDYDMSVDQVGAFSDAYKGGGLSALAKQRKSLAGDKYYKFAQDRRDSSMEAAIDQNFAKGGSLPPRFLSGGGDGMSDSIKANIDGVQEARLADGEFVVPADVVSHLGNGSSKAGAKKLYAMMDKIRKARTGSKRQAPEVNAHKYMPA